MKGKSSMTSKKLSETGVLYRIDYLKQFDLQI